MADTITTAIDIIKLFFSNKEGLYETLEKLFERINIVFNYESYTNLLDLVKLYEERHKYYGKESFDLIIKDIKENLNSNIEYKFSSEPKLASLFFKTYKSIFLDKRKQQINKRLSKDISSMVYKYDYYFSGKVKHFIDGSIPIKNLRKLSENIIVGITDTQISFWDTKNIEKKMYIDYNEMDCLEVLSETRVIVSNSTEDLVIWDIKDTEEPQRILSDHDDIINEILKLPNGNIVSASDDRTLKIWNPKNGQLIYTLTGHTDYVKHISLIDDNHIVSGSSDATLRIWNITTGKCEFVLRGHTDNINCIVIFKDKIISGSADTTIKIWNSKTGLLEQTLLDHIFGITSMILNNNYLISGDYKGIIRLWDLATFTLQDALIGHIRYILYFDFLIDGRLISSSDDSDIRIWDLDTGNYDVIIKTQGSNAPCILVVGDNLIGGIDNGDLIIWE